MAVSNNTSCKGLKGKLMMNPPRLVPPKKIVDDDGILLLLLKHQNFNNPKEAIESKTAFILDEYLSMKIPRGHSRKPRALSTWQECK